MNRSDPPSHLRRRPPAPALPPIPFRRCQHGLINLIVPSARQVIVAGASNSAVAPRSPTIRSGTIEGGQINPRRAARDKSGASSCSTPHAFHDAIRDATPSTLGCEECLKIGSPWVHLRLCRTCGHVRCCDDSPNRRATKHFHKTHHPIIEGYNPPECWGRVASTRLCSISAIAPRRTTVRSRANY